MILCDDDLIEWDDDYPPQLGQEEDKAQSINHKFFEENIHIIRI